MRLTSVSSDGMQITANARARNRVSSISRALGFQRPSALRAGTAKQDISVIRLCSSDDNIGSVRSIPYRRYSITRSSPCKIFATLQQQIEPSYQPTANLARESRSISVRGNGARGKSRTSARRAEAFMRTILPEKQARTEAQIDAPLRYLRRARGASRTRAKPKFDTGEQR